MQVLKDKHVVSYFKDLHSKYVIVPADKAGNNIIFVCKYLYIKTLMEELGIDSTGNVNGTYEAQHDTPDEAIKKHNETIEKKFKIKLTDEEEKLPQMYKLDTETSTKSLTKPDSLLVQVRVLPLGCPS